MKLFDSCFIGIPLPTKYQQSFEDLLININKSNSMAKTVYPKTPHLTIYYLGKQFESLIPNIMEKVTKHAVTLKNIRLTISGLGSFSLQRPKVLFLTVQHPPALSEYQWLLRGELSDYSRIGNPTNFHPHLTVARLYSRDAKEEFHRSHDGLMEIFNNIHWQFPVTEIALYGIDPTKTEKHQEKLQVIRIEKGVTSSA